MAVAGRTASARRSLKNGYIPVDATGDGVYQLLDLLSLCCALDLLYRMSKTYRETHTEDADSSGSAARTVAWCVLGGSRAGGPGRFQTARAA